MGLGMIVKGIEAAARTGASPGPPAHASGRGLSEIRTIDQLARRYGFARPDEVAGPPSASAYLDFGAPHTISDSALTAREQDQEEAWATAVHEAVGSRP
jgi:hypothetical protein